MTNLFKKLAAGAVLTITAFAVHTSDANAADYCREYTRTVYIGSQVQEAYGQACQQPNGDWMIVNEGLGNNNYDLPDNVTNVNYVIRDNNRYVTPTRVVYYDSPRYYRSRATPIFVWNQHGHYKNNHYVSYKKPQQHHRYNNHSRDNRWDRHDNRGNRHDRRDRGHHR